MGIYINSHYAGIGRNFYTSIHSGEVTIKSDHKEGVKERHIVKDGEIVETISIRSGRKSHFIFGESLKVYKRGKLVEERYYEDEQRIKYKGLFYRMVLEDCIVERYSSGGSMCREIVYYKNGNLMYNLGRNKNVKIFNPNGTLFAKIKLSHKKGLWNGKYGIHIDIPNIKKMSATFSGEWYYEFYNKKGEICSWLKGKNGIYLDGVKNGHKLYFIRGIQVPKKVVDEKYDAAYILSYPNVTIRSEMLKKYGVERIIQEMKGVSLDKDQQYELLQFPMPGGNNDNKVIKVLKMKCPSTQVWYALRVPPECQNVYEAINWTYGVDLRDIREGKGVNILGAT